MFKLLSKESNIFSIPAYIGFLLVIVIAFNIFNFNTLDLISAVITFAGIALGYFLINKINLTYQTHLPLFLYTFLIFAFYPGNLDIGLAISLFTNSYLLFLLTSNEESSRQSSYIFVGAILALNFIFLPTNFLLGFFVLMHIIGTSDRIALNIFRLLFGILLVAAGYFSVVFFLNYNDWDSAYLPILHLKPQYKFGPLYILIPVILLLFFAVLNHFQHYNEKSPNSRFKYTFVLVFTLSQLITVVLFMGDNYEYLLLMALPSSIILSRMLRFLPKYWMQEVTLWVIILSLLAFKIADYTIF